MARAERVNFHITGLTHDERGYQRDATNWDKLIRRLQTKSG
jgi:hypothetical protein